MNVRIAEAIGAPTPDKLTNAAKRQEAEFNGSRAILRARQAAEASSVRRQSFRLPAFHREASWIASSAIGASRAS